MTLSRLGPVCGLLFVPLYAGFTFGGAALPEASYSDERVLALYDDGAPFVITATLIALAGAAFLVFLADLHRRLRSGGDGGSPTLTLGAGLLYVAMLFVAGTLWTGYAGGGGGPLEDDPALQHSAALARVLTDMGFGVLLVYGMVAAAVMIAAASAAARRGGSLPRGVVAAGFVVAPLLLAGFTWVPQFLVPLWTAAVSVSLLRGAAPTVVEAAQPTATRASSHAGGPLPPRGGR